MKWKFFGAGDFMPLSPPQNPILWDEILLPKIKDFISSHDFSLIDFEAPISSSEKHTVKIGPFLKGAANSAMFLKNHGVKCVNLANNHMGDFGISGISETIKMMNSSNIHTIGAGSNYDSASEPLFVEFNEIKLGVLGFAERQFGSATNNNGGVYTPSIPELLRKIKTTKDNCDVLITTIHSAQEWIPWPSPQRQDIFKSIVDHGASIVLGHHSHMPQGYEKYKDGYIFYGMGSFWTPHYNSWKNRSNYDWGLSCSITFENTSIDSVSIHQHEINTDGTIELDSPITNSESRKKYLTLCTEPLTKQNELESIWHESSIRIFTQEYEKMLGWRTNSLLTILSELFKVFIKKTGLFKQKVQSRFQNRLLSRWLLLNCFSHHDVITTALGVLSNEISDKRNEETSKIVNIMMPWTITKKQKER